MTARPDPAVHAAVASFLRCNTDPAERKKWRPGEAERLTDDLFRTVPALLPTEAAK